VWDPCKASDPGSCPRQPDRERRAFERRGTWSPLVVERDDGGKRHVLDGRPLHCGTCIELQAIEYRYDDGGEYTVPLQRGELVRYEATWRDGEPRATLHIRLGGHEFSSSLESWMRFRWPPARD
jgi:hypothetical protein